MPVHDPPSPQPGVLADFLHPQSMVTPGFLGGVTMMGTNAFCANFSYLDEHEPVVCLVLSLLSGLAAVISDARLVQRLVYYLLNTIIIYSVAVGANTVGLNQQARFVAVVSAAYAEEGAAPLSHTQLEGGFFRPWFPSEREKVRKGQAPKGDTGPASPPDHHTGNPPPKTAPPSPHH